MILEFAEGAKLYVPLTRLDLIQKYRSTDTGPAPALNRLGSQQWTKTKARVRKAMAGHGRRAAQALRRAQGRQGTAFSPDNEFQREFEDAFDYNETDDQITAIADIKTTWNPPRPWTACSAATWATAKPKSPCAPPSKPCRTASRSPSSPHHRPRLPALRDLQAALRQVPRQRRDDLALPHRQGAERHLERVARRASRHPHRHPPPALQRLKFQDLGLLVVDEEQRFGVRHKERLKQMRARSTCSP
jgi:transcription-repair coupling factor (superfamily II helicase)